MIMKAGWELAAHTHPLVRLTIQARRAFAKYLAAVLDNPDTMLELDL